MFIRRSSELADEKGEEGNSSPIRSHPRENGHDMLPLDDEINRIILSKDLSAFTKIDLRAITPVVRGLDLIGQVRTARFLEELAGIKHSQAPPRVRCIPQSLLDENDTLRRAFARKRGFVVCNGNGEGQKSLWILLPPDLCITDSDKLFRECLFLSLAAFFISNTEQDRQAAESSAELCIIKGQQMFSHQLKALGLLQQITCELINMAAHRKIQKTICDQPFADFYKSAHESIDLILEHLNASEIDPGQKVLTSEVSPDVQTFIPTGRTLRVGFFPVAANPFHWAHLLIGLRAIAEYRLDKVVYAVAGVDPRPDKKLLKQEIRHPMAQRMLKMFEPFFEYSPLAYKTNYDGETNLMRLLFLHYNQKLHAFYIAGSDHYRRTDETGADDTLQKLETKLSDEGLRNSFNPENHHVALVFVARGGSIDQKLQTDLDTKILTVLERDVSSKRIREGDMSILPFSMYRYAEARALYGFTPNPDSHGYTRALRQAVKSEVAIVARALSREITDYPCVEYHVKLRLTRTRV